MVDRMIAKKYTTEEDDYLRKNYKIKSRRELAERLGRTERSIEKRCLSVLKLKKTREESSNIRKKNERVRNLANRESLQGKVPKEWFDLPLSRNEAIDKNTKYFFTGKPCSRGHIDLRFSLYKTCVACINENTQLYRDIIIEALKLKGEELDRNSLINLKGVEVKKIKGGDFFKKYFQGIHNAILKLFPEYKIHLLDFQTQKAPIKKENYRELILEMGRRLGFTKPEDWYSCRFKDFDNYRIIDMS